MTKSPKLLKLSRPQIEDFRGQLLDWYDTHARTLPWRMQKGAANDPYRTWLSEIMLQQTTVQAVKPYYTEFLRRWPDVKALAAAPRDEVMSAWAGLGYYARARNLHECAKIVAGDLGGVFPDSQKELKRLPGIGDYTSAAIVAMAFNKPATVVDGNIERIIARYFAIEVPLPGAKPLLKRHAALFFDGFETRPGDLAQGLMDLGAGVCVPKTPRCALCPVQSECKGFEKGMAANLPRRGKKKERPRKYGAVYWIENEKGEILFHRRPENQMMGGMVGLPTSTWNANLEPILPPLFLQFTERESFSEVASLPRVVHSFSHFDLELVPKAGRLLKTDKIPPEYYWERPEAQGCHMPSLFRKAFSLFTQS